MKLLLSFLSLIYLFTSPVFAGSDSSIYTKDIKFKDGLYLNFFDFKTNKPIPTSKIITNYNKNTLDFFKQELTKTEIKYLDSGNTEQTIKTNKLWGYCSDNNIYINYGKEFSKIMVIGSICHFTAIMEVRLGGTGYYQNAPVNVNSSYQYEQFIIDFKPGKLLAFNVENMEALLKPDDALYVEYMALKKKKKRDLMFFYLRKFNEKHPIYFPS